MSFHFGRLIDHVHLRVADIEASRRFYTAVFAVFEIPLTGSGDNWFQADELYVSPADPVTATSRVHLAFQAGDRARVQAFHDAAIAAGGTDNGGPGERPYHPGYYAAFVLDPDGNNIEAVIHGDTIARSAPSVTLDPA